MSRNTADTPPAIDFHPWPRPIPSHHLASLQLAVLLGLVVILLLTVLPSLSFLHLLINVLILTSFVRRTRKRRIGREQSDD